MNWFDELFSLYEKNKSIVGEVQTIYDNKTKTSKLALLPIFHISSNAEITVTIDSSGMFKDAKKINKDNNEEFTIVPTTENSAIRTSNISAHALCDKLEYLGGDFSDYNKKGKNSQSKYENYMDNLQKWANSNYSHEKVKSIFAYLKKKSLVKDLLEVKILSSNEDNTKEKSENVNSAKLRDWVIRFIVLGDDSGVEECWLDKTLFDAWIKFYTSELNNKSMFEDKNDRVKEDLCYFTGDKEIVSYSFPKYITGQSDTSKLISSNDIKNFTYRGRFNNDEEAFSLGSIATQKIHCALKWIIQKQGYSIDKLNIVIWASNLVEIPDWKEDTKTLLSKCLGKENAKILTGETFATAFNSAMKGYYKNLDFNTNVVILAIDAATEKGSLALIENTVLSASKYLDNIKYWHESCMWEQKNDKFEYLGIPCIEEIITCLYGTDVNKKLKIRAIRRLLPCISKKQRIPIDMVKQAVLKTSSPQKYNDNIAWEKMLRIACSFVKKELNYKIIQQQKTNATNQIREWNLELNEDCTIRDYLYGRLLAIANEIEHSTNKNKDDTNAKRYMEVFSKQPYQTWKIIYERIIPYLSKMNIGLRNYYFNLIEEVMNNFKKDEFTNNEKLQGLYLIGFFHQRKRMFTSKDELKGAQFDKEKKGGEKEMDINCNDRDYLYGCLLAIVNKIEESTYQGEEKRVTNAMKYMGALSRSPYKTWRILYERVNPYLNKMDIGLRNYYLNMIEEVINKFDKEEYSNNSKLQGLYLLGFFNQRDKMKNKIEKESLNGGQENE